MPEVTSTQKIAFGILCAKEVCENEAWNEWADKWLSGEDRTKESAAVDAAAYYAATAAAYAARDGAYYAARAAAYAATAAAYAARAAAYAAWAAADTSVDSASLFAASAAAELATVHP